MRFFYSLIILAGFALSIQAQPGLSLASNSSSFYITDIDCKDGNPYDGIIWPCDFETINCNVFSDPSITGEPVITSNELSQIKISFEDIEHPSDTPSCTKIFRKWTVIDTRLYKQSFEKGIWEYVQTLSLLNNKPPFFISETSDQEFCVYKYDCSADFISLKAKAVDDCTISSEIKYSYEIDLNNNGRVDFKGESNDASDIFPYGKHKVIWFAKDACGNVAQTEFFFKIKDCKPPISNCVNGLMVELLSGKNEITIQAIDFDQGSFDNCELQEFRVCTPSKGEGQRMPPPVDSKSVTFDCSSKGVNSVDFWVKDKSGNWSYSTTFVVVQNNNVDCENEFAEERTLGQKINRFVEEIPLEIEKIVIPGNEIKQSENAGFRIYPSQPNPFETETKISFDLDETTKMTFTILDISGNIVKIIEKEFLAGYNQIMLNKEDFKEAGIFFFTLKSDTHQSTGKIVLIQR